MRSRALHVRLPSNWSEVPHLTPRTYRRNTLDSGILQLSLQPSLETEMSDGEQLVAYFLEMLAGLGMSLGSPIISSHMPCAAGVMATALYRDAQRGLLQFWLIPAEVTVFASWEMGGFASASEESTEAQEILRTVCFEDSDLADRLFKKSAE
jgi:hypothetical protein